MWDTPKADAAIMTVTVWENSSMEIQLIEAYSTKWQSQVYDGWNIMFGKKHHGVQKRMVEVTAPSFYYGHCRDHTIELLLPY